MAPQILPFSFGEESVNAGDVTSVTCTVVKGDSPMSIAWYFNNTEVNTDQGIMVYKAGARVSTLSVESARAEHSGAYTCIARNAAGAANHTAYLHVNGIFYRMLQPNIYMHAHRFKSYRPFPFKTSNFIENETKCCIFQHYRS